MVNRVVYELSLAVRSPFMFEGLVNDRLGIDSAFLRGQDGEAVIPSGQVKGVLRDAMEHLAAATNLVTTEEINSLFGLASASDTEEQDRPSRALAYFSDLSAAHRTDASSVTRIAIDDETGTVKTGHLQVVELAAPLGATEIFTGRVVIRYGKKIQESRIEAALKAAIRLIPSIGAYKSAGFGEVVSAECALTRKSVSALPLSKTINTTRALFEVRFDEPILVNSVRQTDSSFVSSTIIPGAAFKGAIAERLTIAGDNPEEAQSEYHVALSRLRVSHARPVSVLGAEVLEADIPIPESLFYVKTNTGLLIADAIAASGAGKGILFKGISTAPQQVASAKYEIVDVVRKALGLPTFSGPRMARTHVGINEDSDGARIEIGSRSFTAADEKLYSTTRIATRDRVWRLTVDGSRVPDASVASRLMAAFHEELDGIGRTAATASFTEIKAAEVAKLPDGPIVDIMLLTPAVLFDPVENGNITSKDLKALYVDYFKSVLGAELINYFARPVFAGQYQAVRRRAYGKAYYPFVQTKPGAVFRLSLPDEKARQSVEDALQFGLPVPTLGGKAATWKSCPFVPENGYGEVALHRPSLRHAQSDQPIRWLRVDEIEFVEGY